MSRFPSYYPKQKPTHFNVGENKHLIKNILDATNGIISFIAREYNINIEPYKTAYNTLKYLIAYVNGDNKEVLKLITKDALHITIDVLKQIDLSSARNEEDRLLIESISSLNHFLIDFLEIEMRALSK